MWKVGIYTLLLVTATGFQFPNPDSCVINYSDYCKEIGQGCLDRSVTDTFFSSNPKLHLWTIYNTSGTEIKRNFSAERCSINVFGRLNFCYSESLTLKTYGQYTNILNSMTVAIINSGLRNCNHGDLNSMRQIISPYFVFNLYPSLLKIKAVYGFCPSCVNTRIFFKIKFDSLEAMQKNWYQHNSHFHGASYFTLEKQLYRMEPGGIVYYNARCPYQKKISFPSEKLHQMPIAETHDRNAFRSA